MSERSLRALWEEGTQELKNADIEEARLDAWLLLEFTTGVDRAAYYTEPDQQTDIMKAERYRELISRRKKHIPLQHLTQEAWFMGFPFFVNEHVLIPRQDTEILAEEALTLLEGMKEPRILDMCTGSGCILIALLALQKDSSGTGADISAEAIAAAKLNAQRLGVSGRLDLVESDLFSSPYFSKTGGKDIPKYDMLISNPPYIRTADIQNLQDEVRLHDPLIALDGKEDGLFFYREITCKASSFLKRGGYLLFEIGWDQGEAVRQILVDNGFKETAVIKDLAQLDRVVRGRLE